MALIIPKPYLAATKLLDCLCEALAANFAEDDTLPMPARCCVRAGTEIAFIVTDQGVDQCCEGEAYVKIVDTYPSSLFPQPDEYIKSQCQARRRTVALELGVIRCISDDPDCDESDYALRRNAADGEAAFAAACCFDKVVQRADVIGRGTATFFGGWTPSGPDGGCLAGTMPVFVSIPGPGCAC